MKTVPNQRVTITQREKQEGATIFPVSKESLMRAAKTLTPTEVIIWLDLLGNVPNSPRAFSSAYFAESYGFSTSTIQRAFNNFIKTGYAETLNGNTYIIHDTPVAAKTVILPATNKKVSKTPSQGISMEALF